MPIGICIKYVFNKRTGRLETALGSGGGSLVQLFTSEIKQKINRIWPADLETTEERN